MGPNGLVILTQTDIERGSAASNALRRRISTTSLITTADMGDIGTSGMTGKAGGFFMPAG